MGIVDNGVARRLAIRTRLVLAFGTLIVLLGIVASVAAVRLAQLDHKTTEMANVNMRIERIAGDWLVQTREALVRRLVLARSNDPALEALLTPELDRVTARVNELEKKLQDLVDSPEAVALLKTVDEKRHAYLNLRPLIAERKAAGDHAGMGELLAQRVIPAQAAYVESIQAVREYYDEEADRDATEAAHAARDGRKLVIGLAIAGALLALLASWLIARSITRPIDEAMRAAGRVAAGDLSAEVTPVGRDEMTKLLASIGEMTSSLRALVADVAQGAHAVAETSAQIAQGNADLSQRTEEQAGTLEETASSMEELTSTVTQNAGNARLASELAAGAASVAREGGDAMGHVVTTMNGISASSRKIAEIIGVIDGIAFQTNILALNAAVEAARAGEQGRGFAVVAGEVRGLAQRSAEAAKEIRSLIVDSVAQVDAGTAQVDRAGDKMRDIVASVTKVSALIAEIAAASQEQSSGIEQVNTAVTQMDQVVQQNASLVEEAAAATESLKAESEALNALVGRFRLGADYSGAAAMAKSRSRLAAMSAAASGLRSSSSAPERATLAFRASPQ